MTLHFHGTPITPIAELYALAGRCFCVSHARPDQVARCHDVGQSVMLDNGAYSAWKRGHAPDWRAYHAWCDRWLACPTTWCVVPDVIDGGSQMQDALIREWPHGPRQSSPVWHMDEPLHRLLALCEGAWDRVSIGSTAEYALVLSEPWERRMDELFNALARAFGRLPRLHMLRGMQLAGLRWPFYSIDSTDIARHHCRPENTAAAMAARWDAMQCAARWTPAPEQLELVA